ncbi:hypothetical protein ACFOX2_00415 [Corynebacterium marambiense]|uniref:hypothetical protein n=1 Tax=Corynebacterium marambiense TaxID=2765364 RepID=UPI00361104DE
MTRTCCSVAADSDGDDSGSHGHRWLRIRRRGHGARSAPEREAGREVPFAVSLNLRIPPAGYASPLNGVSSATEIPEARCSSTAWWSDFSLLVGYRHRELVNIAMVAFITPHLTAVR